MTRGNIYRVMIGSPSDIVDEIKAAKRIILEWSCLNAEAHNVVVLPLHWKENAYPGVGKHPQKMLDKQLVEKSDMLVCIFGSRIGTATDTSDSGSIEEIEEHIKAGKQVMIFFKKSTEDIYTIDKDQLDKLRQFREDYKGKALWIDYEDVREFEDLFQQKLVLFINANWLNADIDAMEQEHDKQVGFSEEELQIFAHWAQDNTGTPYTHMTFMGNRTEIHLAYKYGVTLHTPQEKAQWEDFMERLCALDYIRLDNYDKYNHPLYKITAKGYEFGKSLKVKDN